MRPAIGIVSARYRGGLALLALLGALLLGGARPAQAAPTAGVADERAPQAPAACGSMAPARAAPSRSQVFSDTFQPASDLFICRVDGAGALAAEPGAGTRGVTPLGAALLVGARWLHFIGYALGLGTLAAGLLITAAPGDRSLWTARVWRLVGGGIALLLAAEPLALLGQTIGAGQSLLDPNVAGEVLASGFGLVWAQRLGVALLLWTVTGAVKAGSPRALWAAPALGLALALIDGGAGAAGARSPVLAVAAAALHEAAMGVLIGGIAWLTVLWRDLAADRRSALLVRLRRLAGAAVGALAISGATLAALRAPAGLFGGAWLAGAYGAILAIKLLAALLAGGLALLGRRRAALGALLAVLGAASLLVTIPPP